MPELVTHPDVEILQLGTHKSVLGEVTIDQSTFDSILEASKDEGISKGYLRPGHFDKRFSALDDGDPALGWISNLRQVGDKLLGDMVGIPKSFGETMLSMYRNRSATITKDTSRTTGKQYKAVLKNVALLGATEPAITTLADIMALSAAGNDSATHVVVVDDDGTAAGAEALQAARKAVIALAATTGATEGVAKQLEELDALVPGSDNPPIPAQELKFGKTAPLLPDDQGGPVAVDEKRIRELLKLEENADVEAELKKLIASDDKGEGKEGDDGKSKSSEGGEGDGKDGEGKEADDAAKAAKEAADKKALEDFKVPEGMSVISQEVLDKLIAGAANGDTAAAKLAEADRDAELVALSSQGKIDPAEIADFRELLKVAPEATRKMLAARPANAQFATLSRGSDTTDNRSNDAADAAFDAFESQMFGLDRTKA